MLKKLHKTDALFASALLLGLLFHIFFIFIVPFSDDESFYSLVSFRILNGDSLIQDEWHLTQFSALFAYLPVYIWNAIKGSTEGIIIFMRCVYLLIHTTTAIVVYRFFRKHGVWAIMASMMFYMQVAYYIQAISYQSIFAIFLLMLGLCLLSIYQKGSIKFYVLAGVCFGCCCVCNPILCFAFALYLLGCIMWLQREKIVALVLKIKAHSQEEKKVTKRQKRQQKQQVNEICAGLESYNCFFTVKAILLITCGILIVAIIAACFYFSTGGTVKAIFNNMENLLSSTEYDIASKSIIEKIGTTFSFFNMVNFEMFWIIPVLFLAVGFDKKRNENMHRFVYLCIALAWGLFITVGIVKNLEIYVCGFSLPFFVISILSYVLTENKNKVLFNCMFVPTLIFIVFHYIAADTHLGAIGIVAAISNVAGVLFARDLFKEMSAVTDAEDVTTKKKYPNFLKGIIIASVCVQIVLYGFFNGVCCKDGILLSSNTIKVTSGPYANLYMSESQYDRYQGLMNDMDYIKSITNKKMPVLLITYDNWLYLHLDRPVATYTAWYRGSINKDLLINYYKANPDKVPKYIYIPTSDPSVVSELFGFTSEPLSNGVLLTVTGCKF